MTAPSTDWLRIDEGERSESGRPKYDPATRYGIKIVQKQIVAPDKVVKVYERHLDDLDRSKLPNSGIRWQPRELARFYYFCRQYCMIPDRLQAEIKMLELLPMYLGTYGLFLGWKVDNPSGDPKIDPMERKHGSARYRTLLLETPKHSGKTPTAAAFILYHLTGQLPPPAREGVKPEDPPVIFIGTDLMDQNLVIRGFMDRMIEGDFFQPDAANVEFARGEYYCETTRGICLLKSAKGRGKGTSGFAPSLLVFDECQDWESLILRDNLLMGLGKRIEARTTYLMNAGTRDVSPIWPERAKAGRIAEGISHDDSYLPMIWGVDSRDEPLESEESWPKAYPTMGYTVQRATVLEAVSKAKLGSAHERSNVMRLNFGRWARAVSEDWLDFSVIESCFRKERPERNDWHLLPCVPALDLSRSSDLTGFAVAWWLPGGDVWIEADGYTCDRGLGKIAAKAEDLPIRDWIAESTGGIQLANTVTGEMIDYEPIARRLVEFAENHNVQAVGIDAYGKERFYDVLHGITQNYVRDTAHDAAHPVRPGGLVFVEHPNTKFRKPLHFAGRQKDHLYIHDTIERMGQRMSSGSIGFLDNPALAWNFGCVQVQRQGESMVMMKSAAMEVMAGRIDIVAASFYALGILEKVVGTEARREESHASQMSGMAKLAALMRGEVPDELDHDT